MNSFLMLTLPKLNLNVIIIDLFFYVVQIRHANTAYLIINVSPYSDINVFGIIMQSRARMLYLHLNAPFSLVQVIDSLLFIWRMRKVLTFIVVMFMGFST